jgi:osmotically-inducible protein OsmY
MKIDTDLQRDVLDELRWEPGLDAANIGVAVQDGVVTLTGTVPSYSQRWAAEQAAKRVYGVRALANEIQVRLTAPETPTDVDIARAARAVLDWDVALPADKIKVTVSDGRVKLEGEVEWQFQKTAAARAVRDLRGVKEVINLIMVKPKAQPADLKAQIEVALRRQAELDARRISVETDGSKVILWGVVHSWAEREAAENAAWAAPGVTDVENRIKVMP